MGKRRKARELAMQALYSMDMGKNLHERQFALYRDCFPPPAGIEIFFNTLVSGVIDNIQDIDHVIENFSSNWKVARMACVDRNIMRIATFEMLYCRDIPQKVSINEAIDIGKKFGTEESGGFINGILDSIRQALEKGELEQRSEPIRINEKI